MSLLGLGREKLRVIIYVRVSTEEQAREGHSLEAQEKICRAFADGRGWTIVAVYRDPEDDLKAQPTVQLAQRKRKAQSSGKTDRRPGFQKLIGEVRAGRADVVLTHKLDRFSRSITDILLYLREFNRLGVAYTSATEQFDFTTPIGKVMLTLLAAFAEWYLDNLSQETKKGKRERAEKGYWNGDLPFGYRLSAGGDDAEPDPETAPGVVLAFTEYAKGNRTDLAIARILNAANFRTRGKRGSIPFSKDTVRSMLLNPFFTGQVSYKGELFMGRHAPIVSPDLFEACQAARRRMGVSPRRGEPKHNRVYLLAGLLVCADCHRPHRGQTIHAYRYYRDSDRDYDGSCPNRRNVKADEAEEFVATILTSIRMPDAWKEQLRAGGPSATLVDDTERRRARAEAKIRRANELYVEQMTDRDAYDRVIREARAELDALRPVGPHELLNVAELLDNFPKLWAAAQPEERKTLLQSMIERVFVRGTEIVAIQPRPDFYTLLHFVCCGPDGRPVSDRLTLDIVAPACMRLAIVPPATPNARLPDYIPARP